MSEIEKKALALFNEVARERGATHDSVLLDRAFVENEALCRAIEQHEAFRQEVSDAVERAQTKDWDVHPVLWRFIIAEPVDPLVEAWMEAWPNDPLEAAEKETQALREALAKRGGKIVWEG
jgi:hypothetical protein